MNASIYDPQVEFLEIGVNVNGVQAYKVYGPDLNGTYGGLQGTGGLEATIMNGTGAATGKPQRTFLATASPRSAAAA